MVKIYCVDYRRESFAFGVRIGVFSLGGYVRFGMKMISVVVSEEIRLIGIKCVCF